MKILYKCWLNGLGFSSPLRLLMCSGRAGSKRNKLKFLKLFLRDCCHSHQIFSVLTWILLCWYVILFFSYNKISSLPNNKINYHEYNSLSGRPSEYSADKGNSYSKLSLVAQYLVPEKWLLSMEAFTDRNAMTTTIVHSSNSVITPDHHVTYEEQTFWRVSPLIPFSFSTIRFPYYTVMTNLSSLFKSFTEYYIFRTNPLMLFDSTFPAYTAEDEEVEDDIQVPSTTNTKLNKNSQSLYPPKRSIQFKNVLYVTRNIFYSLEYNRVNSVVRIPLFTLLKSNRYTFDVVTVDNLGEPGFIERLYCTLLQASVSSYVSPGPASGLYNNPVFLTYISLLKHECYPVIYDIILFEDTNLFNRYSNDDNSISNVKYSPTNSSLKFYKPYEILIAYLTRFHTGIITFPDFSKYYVKNLNSTDPFVNLGFSSDNFKLVIKDVTDQARDLYVVPRGETPGSDDLTNISRISDTQKQNQSTTSDNFVTVITKDDHFLVKGKLHTIYRSQRSATPLTSITPLQNAYFSYSSPHFRIYAFEKQTITSKNSESVDSDLPSTRVSTIVYAHLDNSSGSHHSTRNCPKILPIQNVISLTANCGLAPIHVVVDLKIPEFNFERIRNLLAVPADQEKFSHSTARIKSPKSPPPSFKPRVILIGGQPSYWPIKLLIQDSILYFLRQRYSHPISHPYDDELVINDILKPSSPSPYTNYSLQNILTRYVQFDIDDAFVGETKPSYSDMQALIDNQMYFRQNYIENFTFNLGFSGYYYLNSLIYDGAGYKHLMKNHHHFTWFLHSFGHISIDDFKSADSLIELFEKNVEFAKRYNLDISSNYSVTPRHSGLYPIIDYIYDAWKSHGIKYTSTYMFPSLRPTYSRRAFVYKNVTVLPRKTCGVFTHNLKYREYPGGIEKLDYQLLEEDTYEQIIYDKFNIFMTHVPNYIYDRLALYIINLTFSHFKAHTNFRFVNVRPDEFAQLYLLQRPLENRPPVYRNPCLDRNLYSLYNRTQECYKFPKILVVGPQKTGTTALLTFLKLHPLLRTNRPTKHYEETQFFSDSDLYVNKGMNWYLDLFNLEPDFPYEHIRGNDIQFVDKSASYFDKAIVPSRAYNLLPFAYIIITLIDPVDRAYSWYQHQIKHSLPVSLKYTFYQVIKYEFKNVGNREKSSNSTNNERFSLRALQKGCLLPGLYYKHILRWLKYYPFNKIIIVDSEDLKQNPIPIMDRISDKIGLKYDNFSFENYIEYDPKKQFYCPIVNGVRKCLGKSKGSKYQPMDSKSRQYLEAYYNQSNIILYKLLIDKGLDAPYWLKSKTQRYI